MMNVKASNPVVFIVDDDPAVRDSLQMLVRRLGFGIRAFESAEAFLKQYDPQAPGCLVLDIRMDGMTGLELQDRLYDAGALIPVIFITGFGDIPTAVQATKKGAVDFIEKPFSRKALLERIQEAVERDLQRRKAQAKRTELEERLNHLSPRERQVMDLVISGMTSRQIAEELCRSEKTIKAHRLHLMKKLKARTSAELARIALTVQLGRADLTSDLPV